jgi:hypothetical protein
MAGVRPHPPRRLLGNLAEIVRSAENLAALMAPEDRQSVHLQRSEDSSLRRMCRLINAFGKIREGILQNKKINKVRSKPECV